VSTATTQAMEVSLYPTYNVLSKMMYADPAMRGDIMCIGGTSQWPTTIFRGVDQWGEDFGYLLIDPIGGAIGAFTEGDGISTGGQSRTPICKLPNIEHTEQSFPLLFLYRKELTDSGGPGKYRGGLSAETCFIPHNTARVTHDTLSSGNAVPTSTGMMGGYPGTVNIYRFLKDSDIEERIASRRMIHDMSELRGEEVTLGLREENFEQRHQDVYAVAWSAAGGFGDPMERDPQLVFEDWQNGLVSHDSALSIYGVVIDQGGRALDRHASESWRENVRAGRLQARRGDPEFSTGALLFDATETIAVRRDGDGIHHCCSRCHAKLGSISENYKEHCLLHDAPVTHATPLAGDPHRYIDATPVFRQFFCPGCGRIVENEVAIAGSPIVRDIAIDGSALENAGMPVSRAA
jgi:N-methylhydantoinase B